MHSSQLIFTLLILSSAAALNGDLLITPTHSIGNTSLAPDLESSLGILALNLTSAKNNSPSSNASSSFFSIDASQAIEPILRPSHTHYLVPQSSRSSPAFRDSTTMSDAAFQVNSSDGQIMFSLNGESILMTTSLPETREHNESSTFKEITESSFEITYGHTPVIQELKPTPTLNSSKAITDFLIDSRTQQSQQIWSSKLTSPQDVISNPALYFPHKDVLATTGFPELDTSIQKPTSATGFETFTQTHTKTTTMSQEMAELSTGRLSTPAVIMATSLQEAAIYIITDASTKGDKDIERSSLDLRTSSMFTNIAVGPSLYLSENVGDSMYISQTVGAIVSSSQSVGTFVISSDPVGASMSSSESFGAFVSSSKSDGALVSSSESVGALLSSSESVGAFVSTSESNGASMSSSESVGAFVISSKSVGTFVSSSKSDGAFVSSSESVGTLLSSSESVGESLQSTYYFGASLHSSEYVGASLHSSEYVGASLHSSEYVGASLHSSESVGAYLQSSYYVGASLHSTVYAVTPTSPPLTEMTTSTMIQPTQVSGERNMKAFDTHSATLNVDFNIKYKLIFLQDYLDSTSLDYINIKENFTQQLTELYKSVTHFKRIDIQGFRNGSIIVDFNLALRAFGEDKNIINPSRLIEDLKNVKTKLQRQQDIDLDYLNGRYDDYVEKGVRLAESATRNGCLFQHVCDDAQYACVADLGECVLKCRQHSHGDPIDGVCKCLHGSKSGDIVSSEMECWDGAHNGHGKMRSTEVIALSVSLILAVIILMSIFTACVLQVGQNRYKKVERELTLTPDKGQMRIEIKESLDTVQIDHELEGEFQTTEFRQNLDLDIEPTQDEVHQHAEPSHEMNYPMDEADFCHVIPGQSNDEEDIECDNFRFDWRDVAFNTRPLRLPRIAMADESND